MDQMTHQEAETILEALDNSIAEVEEDVDNLIIQQGESNQSDVHYLSSTSNFSIKVRYLHKRKILENGKAGIILQLINQKKILKEELENFKKKYNYQDPFPARNFNKRLSNYFLQYVEVGLMIIDKKLNYFEEHRRSFT